MKLKKLFKSIKLFIKNKYIHIFMMYWGYKATRLSIRTYRVRLKAMDEYLKIITKSNPFIPSEREVLERAIKLYREESCAIESDITKKEVSCNLYDEHNHENAINLDYASLYPSWIREINFPLETQTEESFADLLLKGEKSNEE